MLRRTSFKHPARPERKPMAWPSPISGGRVAVFTELVLASPKEDPIRSEPYRRLVAMLPCANCGIEDQSQAAHPPPTGKGIKEDDRMCFPMCCTRPGTLGCHALFDQYKLMPKASMRKFAADCAADTRDTIEGNGMWPKNLPFFPSNPPCNQHPRAQAAIKTGA